MRQMAAGITIFRALASSPTPSSGFQPDYDADASASKVSLTFTVCVRMKGKEPEVGGYGWETPMDPPSKIFGLLVAALSNAHALELPQPSPRPAGCCDANYGITLTSGNVVVKEFSVDVSDSQMPTATEAAILDLIKQLKSVINAHSLATIAETRDMYDHSTVGGASDGVSADNGFAKVGAAFAVVSEEVPCRRFEPTTTPPIASQSTRKQEIGLRPRLQENASTAPAMRGAGCDTET
jgi:hypothetical protein